MKCSTDVCLVLVGPVSGLGPQTCQHLPVTYERPVIHLHALSGGLVVAIVVFMSI